MASVTSLDQDMKKLRMDRYTPKAANEVRSWIEDVLGERLPPGDLLDALKDGTVLCRLVNMAIPTPVRFKKSAMPFIQMENISHFLRACEQPPLNMPAHDRFLTVDLYEAKDPAQVLQCLGAFSRVANAKNPSNFPTTIGPKRGPGPLSPSVTGGGGYTSTPMASPGFGRSRGPSTASNTSGSSTFNPLARPPAERTLSAARTGGSDTSYTSNGLPKSPPGGVSSWSKKVDEGSTAPAWNIHQYGYMGGASQGNQGIAFGARRQITSAGPHVPNLAEKERLRREKAAEEERLRLQAEEAEHKRRIEREAEEERIRIEEEQKWEEESRKQQEAKQARLDQQKQREAQAQLEAETRRKRAGSDARLKGQYLSQYQAEQANKPRSRRGSFDEPNAERDRIRELEQQLEEAKERERQYQAEREGRLQEKKVRSRSKSRTRERSKSRARPAPPPRAPSPQDSNVSWAQEDDRAYLRKQWDQTQRQPARPLPEPTPPSLPTRPLPEPATRPLPDPAIYAKQSRTDRYLASNPAPAPPKPQTYIPPELTSTSEQRGEDARRAASQAKTKAAGTGSGQSWDVNQYGYMGGDNQNKLGGIGGGKRQIIGPRPFGPR
ncbi:Calponin [Pyrenophora tritici-repentis]|uniref:SCP1, Calponin n=1 Tax=Pyrenophora tritici-repentis TaxID=45151 RepID=A0A2W1EBC0_9PLEO|nr:Calponin [Pyrenophora tritici-repentis]KAF7454799.1 Calponin [Pyrenophora tritici-repentis]KAF7577931.1 SCP1, Calponin [Pyrenophora tritici-repentis]KAI0583392.1 Calponin [Pyrenophora tritici-repentis]KAI0586582.1 Calponin [Pyrenophora tritici-repentis]